MDNNKIAEFIKKQKVAFICSVDEDGFPNVKAMLPDSLRSAVDYLLDIKVNALEKAEIKPVSEIDIFLSEGIAKFDEIMKSLPQDNNCGWDMMNEFFISEIEK